MSLAKDVENLRREVEMLRRVVCKLPLRQPHGGGVGRTGALVKVYPNYSAMSVDTVDIGALGITEDLGNLYAYDGDKWRIAYAFVQADEPDQIGEQDGDRWYDSGNHIGYIRIDGEWVPDTHFAEPETP